jgi:hypothetical protein
MKKAFIILTHCSSPNHLNLLLECIKRVRLHFPGSYIYILNDHSMLDLSSSIELKSILERGDCSLHLTKHQGAGELNPYLFALSSECRHERFVYIHDSVMVNKAFDVDTNEEIKVFWRSSKSLFEHVFQQENREILQNLKIQDQTLHTLLRSYERQKGNFCVAFGAMSHFSKSFAQKMVDSSNLREVANLFKTRVNRCLFERILVLFILLHQGDRPVTSMCGDIQMHPMSFRNTNVNLIHPGVLTKVWQGR